MSETATSSGRRAGGGGFDLSAAGSGLGWNPGQAHAGVELGFRLERTRGEPARAQLREVRGGTGCVEERRAEGSRA